MSFRSWLIKKLLIKKGKKPDAAEDVIDDYILTSQKDHSDVLRLAKKINKGKILQLQTRAIMNEIPELDDNDEEEEAAPDIQDQIVQQLLGKFIGSGGVQTKADPKDLADLAKTLTPEQTKILQEKGFL